MNKFDETFSRLLETVQWEDSNIPVTSKPLQRILLNNKELTAKYGFVLFSHEDHDNNIHVIAEKLPESILTRDGVKEFTLALFKELKIPKRVRRPFIKITESLRYFLMDRVEGIR